jgi:5-methylcytosine-specific restriction endonuclease McrA
LEREVRKCGYKGKLAYYHLNYTRTGAPLLDELAVELDHVECVKRGGIGDRANLVTCCNKCNGLKSDTTLDEWELKHQRRKRTKGKEPEDWDGLSSLFVILAEQYFDELTATEKGWLRALR